MTPTSNSAHASTLPPMNEEIRSARRPYVNSGRSKNISQRSAPVEVVEIPIGLIVSGWSKVNGQPMPTVHFRVRETGTDIIIGILKKLLVNSDEAGVHRSINCVYYNSCLDVATSRKWSSFSCQPCPCAGKREFIDPLYYREND
jgi:hypothetical protein